MQILDFLNSFPFYIFTIEMFKNFAVNFSANVLISSIFVKTPKTGEDTSDGRKRSPRPPTNLSITFRPQY